MIDATFAAAGFIPTKGWAGNGSTTHLTLDLYKDADTFSMLRQTDYGIYGLASDNGFSEYITGKDQNGQILSEDKRQHRDRKSTRLNSSHVAISYAVFCLKKKKKQNNNKI